MNKETRRRPTNITEFILKEQALVPESSGELTNVINDLAYASKIVANIVRKAGLLDIKGKTGGVNIQGEEVLKLDDYANNVFKETLGNSRHIAGFASEEEDDFVAFPEYSDQKYIVSIDPLDGSSNFDVNVSVGTIFSIDQRISDSGEIAEDDFLQAGKKQVCAGYFLYGSSTVFVYTTGNGVNMFTLDPDIGEYILSERNIQIPKKGKVYSINDSYSDKWYYPQVNEYIERMKLDHTARYIGSMVADFHRNMLDGGVFLYPGDVKNPKGKLRLNFECKQLAFIAEQAGGRAIDGDNENILDIKPHSLHQRTPIIVGSKEDVDAFEQLMWE